MRLLYNILFPVFFLISTPFYFWKLVRRGNWWSGFGQRFGMYGRLRDELKAKRVLWFHAVSVGEANLAVQLIKLMQVQEEGVTFVISTTTTTGMSMIKAKLPEGVHAIYYPIDWLPFVKWAFGAINPAAVVLVEAEIWPNLIWEAENKNVPVHLINARLSENSFNGYLRFAFLFKPLFRSLHAAGVHNESDAKRLAELGCDHKTITVTGNMKFDGTVTTDANATDARTMLREIGVPDEAPVLVAGSTFEGEEELLCKLLPQWRKEHPNLFLVLVPRHFERASAVLENLKSMNLRIIRRTAMNVLSDKPDVLLVDTTGELKAFYEVATLVFVGKSLTAQGGQNPIEPAALGRPMIFGPFMQNFKPVVQLLLEAEAAIQVADEEGLAKQVSFLLGKPEQREALGMAAQAVVERNKGATQRTAELIGQTLRALG